MRAMDAIYERSVTGADVVAAAVATGLDAEAIDRLMRRVAAADRFACVEDLAAVAGPPAIAVPTGRWNAVFAPLFGEFE